MNETAARHPNRFLADLTQAMRMTAESARQGTIEQAQADAKTYVERLHARTDDEAGSLRKAADTDVAAIRDWSKAEMERIRVETEQRVSRRRELLDQELQEYNAAIELEVQRVERRVQGFEEEVAQFFEQLLQEADPTIFASMASQMPDPPAFTDVANGSMTSELRARREQIMRTDVALPDLDAGGSNGAQPDAKRDADGEEGETRRGAGGPKAAGRESTQVVVVGLVSVPSIATFKRQLGRLPGVKNVGVLSGPDGEFIFTVGHGADTSLSTLLPTLPAFQARVVNEHEGVLNVSVHDPEAEG